MSDAPDAPEHPSEFKPIAFEEEQDAPASPKAAANDAMVSYAVDGIEYLHEQAAILTKYEGCRMSPGLRSNWRNLFTEIFKKLPKKDWGLIVSAIFVLVGELLILYGYAQLKNNTNPNAGPMNNETVIAPSRAPPAAGARGEVGVTVDIPNRGPPP